MTLRQLHRESGVSLNNLSLIANNKAKGIQYDTLGRILSALDCKVEDILEFIPESISFYAKVNDISESSVKVEFIITDIDNDFVNQANDAKEHAVDRLELKFNYDVKETSKYVFVRLIYREILKDFTNKKYNNIFLKESTSEMYDVNKIKRKYQVFSSVIAHAVLSDLIDKKIVEDSKIAFHMSWSEFPLYEISKKLFEISFIRNQLHTQDIMEYEEILHLIHVENLGYVCHMQLNTGIFTE